MVRITEAGATVKAVGDLLIRRATELAQLADTAEGDALSETVIELRREAEDLMRRVNELLGAASAPCAPATPPAELPLTRRELEIIRLIAAGESTEVMSARLFVSRHTVRNHVRHILEKLQVHTKLEAVLIAARAGLLPLVPGAGLSERAA